MAEPQGVPTAAPKGMPRPGIIKVSRVQAAEKHAEKAEYHNLSSTGGKAAFWEKKAEKHKEPEPKKNPSSGSVEWDGTCYRQKLDKHGDDYGRPPPGSLTELRGKKAGMLVSSEVIEVCFHILRVGLGRPDGTYIVGFGFLFEFYTKISNKLVGMLLRARRQGLVDFEGEMLYQRRDDDKIIKLVKVPKALEEYYIEMHGSIPDAMKNEY